MSSKFRRKKGTSGWEKNRDYGLETGKQEVGSKIRGKNATSEWKKSRNYGLETGKKEAGSKFQGRDEKKIETREEMLTWNIKKDIQDIMSGKTL